MPSVRSLPKEAEAAAPDGERKTVTALFADIKGSMELMEDLDPEEARAIVDAALKLMMGAVHRYDGYIVQSRATASSHCLARRSRMRTIHNARFTPPSPPATICAAEATTFGSRAAPESRSVSASTLVRS
jgi:class 3 adenylate cyclase